MNLTDTPTIDQLNEWLDAGYMEATDGCIVDPDGVCEHGCESWLLFEGMI